MCQSTPITILLSSITSIRRGNPSRKKNIMFVPTVFGTHAQRTVSAIAPRVYNIISSTSVRGWQKDPERRGSGRKTYRTFAASVSASSGTTIDHRRNCTDCSLGVCAENSRHKHNVLFPGRLAPTCARDREQEYRNRCTLAHRRSLNERYSRRQSNDIFVFSESGSTPMDSKIFYNRTVHLPDAPRVHLPDHPRVHLSNARGAPRAWAPEHAGLGRPSTVLRLRG